MISVLLSILKFLGIVLLILLGTILVVAALVLFVPFRYRVSVCRKEEEDAPVYADIKATWLLHILNVAFSYPNAAYLRVRVFCLTVFRSDRPKKGKKSKKGKKQEKAPQGGSKKGEGAKSANEDDLKGQQKEEEGETSSHVNTQDLPPKKDESEKKGQDKDLGGQHGKSLLKKIRYTITSICDKIKDIVNNIRYYMEIIKSEAFGQAFKACSGELFSLLKYLLPGKFSGYLLVGTGDPASTGQVLAIYGILYPLLGGHIDIEPDFERKVFEGKLLIKGKITVFRLLKSVCVVFFNRDIRKVIKLLKREAA